jgi:SPP1 family predicted phage head-tail adaptor
MKRSGTLNTNLGIFRKTVTKNDFGEYSEVWALHKEVRGYIHYNSGSQVIDNNEVFELIKLKITIRKQTDITELDRLEVNGNMYIIEFIQQDYTKRWQEIRCTRINE